MLEAYSYVAILYAKNAELTALEKIDQSIKSRFFPVLGVRPGQHVDFYKSADKFKEATKGYRIGITLDETKFSQGKIYPASTQFDALFDSSLGFKNFYDFVQSWEAAIPVLQSYKGNFLEVERQIENAEKLDRGFLVRVRQSESNSFLDCLERNIFFQKDIAIIIDAEWQENVLLYENWASQLIGKITFARPDLEIVCVSSSFPRDFSHIEGRGVTLNDDRELFDRIRRNHNAANLKFGDWGSTRSASEQRGAKPRPRIDIATARDWVTFRQKKDGKGGFPEVSSEAEKDRIWLSTPDCWGKRAIELTSLKRPQQIKGNQSANAARINIHLTVQAMSGVMTELPEEPFKDDF